MDLITCSKCEKQIREVAVFCPYCGFQLSQETVSKQKEEQHEFNNPVKNSSPREKETFDSWMRKPHPVAGIVTFLIIVIPLLLWDSFKSFDFSIFSKENTKDIIKSSPNIPVKPKLIKVDIAVERENRRKKVDSINRESNRIAKVAFGDMPKRYINVDSLRRVYKKFAADSAELGLKYANSMIDLKNKLIMERDHIKWSKSLSTTYNENIEQESKPNMESKPYSSSSNGYIVKNEAIWAATSQASFDLMMNCLISGDKEALKVMINNGQLIYLHRNDVVFVVKVKLGYSIVRQEGSTELLYVDNEFIQKQ